MKTELLLMFVNMNYSIYSEFLNCMHNHLRMEIFCPNRDVVYILLLIICYIGNSTTKHHSRSMSDNRDLIETFHQKISSHYKVIASAF